MVDEKKDKQESSLVLENHKQERNFRTCYPTPDKNPAVMVDESDPNNAIGYVITHSEKKEKVTKHQLHQNPDKTDKRKSFLLHTPRKGAIGYAKTFSPNTLKGYELSEQDEKELELINKAKIEGKPWNEYLPNYQNKSDQKGKKKTGYIGSRQETRDHAGSNIKQRDRKNNKKNLEEQKKKRENFKRPSNKKNSNQLSTSKDDEKSRLHEDSMTKSKKFHFIKNKKKVARKSFFKKQQAGHKSGRWHGFKKKK